MRETVPCGIPVFSLMAVCVQPIPISAASFSDVFMHRTIRTHIADVNTLSHRMMKNNDEMGFREWLRAEMDSRKIGPSDLAKTSKVPQPTIFRILSGETKDPRTGTVKRLERALGASSPPLDDGDTEQYKVVADFAAVYQGVDDDGKEFLRKSIIAARSAFMVGRRSTPRLTVITERRKADKGKD